MDILSDEVLVDALIQEDVVSFFSMTYTVIGLPPSDVGATQVISMELVPILITSSCPGAPGTAEKEFQINKGLITQ